MCERRLATSVAAAALSKYDEKGLRLRTARGKWDVGAGDGDGEGKVTAVRSIGKESWASTLLSKSTFVPEAESEAEAEANSAAWANGSDLPFASEAIP